MFDADTLDQLADALATRLLHRLPQHQPSDRDLLDIEEVATRLGQSAKSVRRLIDSGDLKSVHVNSKVQVRAATLDQFIRIRERRS